MTTLELGRISTCRRPRFSALEIVFRQSAKTDIRTIYIVVLHTQTEWTRVSISSRSPQDVTDTRQPRTLLSVTLSPRPRCAFSFHADTSYKILGISYSNINDNDTPFFQGLGPFGLDNNTSSSEIKYHEARLTDASVRHRRDKTSRSVITRHHHKKTRDPGRWVMFYRFTRLWDWLPRPHVQSLLFVPLRDLVCEKKK